MISSSRSMPRWALPVTVGAVLAPLLGAALAQRNAGWHPVFDLAMTELRVRDVGGRHTPLIGLQGRIGATGSHPGPLSFYLLAPTYRMLGSSAFALQAATLVFHAAGIATALWVVRRRDDLRLLLGVAVLLLLLVQGYGLGPLTEPWNPHLPMLWFVAFLVSAWAVIDGDLPMLLPAVFAASVCAQTHVPYLAVTIGLGSLVAVVAVARAWRHRHDPARSRDGRWLAAAVGLGLLLWAPPLLDEVRNDPGNLTQIVDHIGTPTETPIGVREGAELVVERLDAWQLVVGETRHPGTYVRILSGPGPTLERGMATFGLWVLAVAAAAALRHRRLLALHGLVGAGVAVAVVAVSRIHGVPWHYLMLWVFGIGALMALSIASTLLVVVGRRRPTWIAPRGPATVVTAALASLLVVRLLVLAPDVTTDTPDQTAQLARLLPDTVAALDASDGAATGTAGRYYVYWDDATTGGAVGIGLVNELVRRGFDVGVDARDGVKIGLHRVRDARDATARVVLASGGWIERWAHEPGAVRVAYDDPRTAAERAEFAAVRAEALDLLEERGRPDLVAQLDTDLFNVALNEQIDVGVGLLVGRMIDLGVPVAVFVLPTGEAG